MAEHWSTMKKSKIILIWKTLFNARTHFEELFQSKAIQRFQLEDLRYSVCSQTLNSSSQNYPGRILYM